MTDGKSLQQLCGAGGETVVRGLAVDSRRVTPGDLFLARAGAVHDGHEHVAEAVARGAAAVCSERPVQTGVPNVVVPDLRARLGAIAARFFDDPSAALTCIGVTGTNGKTSIAWLCAATLDDTAVAGTLGWGLPPHLCPSTLTTADPVVLQERLRRLADRGVRRVALEASSHALDQGRVADVRFEVAVFSNLTRDHLDYHGTMDRYAAAKRRLFEAASPTAAIVNVDDAMGRELARAFPGETVTYGSAPDAAVSWSDIAWDPGGIKGRWRSPWGTTRFRLPLFGDFSLYNAAAALATACVLGARFDDAVARMASVRPVPGRMQPVPGVPDGPTVIVDYAHTPAALAAALAAARRHLTGSLTCVFGCGGDRDPGKRPLMAKAVESRADAIVLTSDNPRGEDPGVIIEDTLAGCERPDAVTVEADRASAVRLAIARSGAGDVVLIAGKGHEDYQEVAGKRIPYSDAEIAREALEAGAAGVTGGPR